MLRGGRRRATGRGLRHARKGVCLPGAGSRGAVPVASLWPQSPAAGGCGCGTGVLASLCTAAGGGARRAPSGAAGRGLGGGCRRRRGGRERCGVPGGGGAFLAPRSGSGRELRDGSAFTARRRAAVAAGPGCPSGLAAAIPYAFTCWSARSGPRLSAPSGRRCPAAGGGGAGNPCSAAGFM